MGLVKKIPNINVIQVSKLGYMSSWRLKLYPVRKFPPITKESTGVETQCGHPPGLQQLKRIEAEKTPKEFNIIPSILMVRFRFRSEST
mgnify:FL=1